MVRRSVLGVVAILTLVLGCVMVANPVGAVVDSATIVSAPSPGTSFTSSRAISCVTASSCVATGGFFSQAAGKVQTLALHWDGASWTQVSSLSPGSNDNYLFSVSCVTAASCVAVGQYYSGNDSPTFVLRWDGVSWTQMAAPSPSTIANRLSSVSCVSASSCVAVGAYFDGNVVQRTFALHWDGTSWMQMTTPNNGAAANSLFSVSCVSASSCIAAGLYDNGSGVYQTLVLRWDGVSWTPLTSPNNGSSDNGLMSVSCASSSSCVAVGYYVNGSGAYQTLVLSWDGVSWAQVNSPNGGTNYNQLSSVSCASESSCVAVGQSNNNDPSRTLVLRWDGVSWTLLASPNSGSANNALDAVSCASESSCVAFGSFYDGDGVQRTLMLSLTGPEPEPTTTTTTAAGQTTPGDPVVPAFTG
jgi:hypothetical protein